MAESSEPLLPAYHHHNQLPPLPAQPQHPQHAQHPPQGLPITALVYPHSPSTLSRPFRSRKNRPCDACRRAKTRCAIPNVGPPCVECQQTGKPCTFDEQPPARKRPPKRPASPKDDATASGSTAPAAPRESAKRQKGPQPLPPGQAYLSSPTAAQHGLEALMQAATRERESQLLNRRVNASAGSTLRLPHQQQTGPVTHQPRYDPSSLDMNITPEFEPYAITALLTDDLLPIGARARGEGDKDAINELGIRQISSDAQKPQYIIMSKRPEFPPISPHSHLPAILGSLLPTIQPAPSIPALLTLYLTHSNPAFPLFMYPTAQPTPSSPPCILVEDTLIQAKISLIALSHSSHCRPFARSFRNVMSIAEMNSATGGGEGLSESQLGSISKTLLDLGAREDVRQNAQRNYLTLARTIAQAQLGGLHIDSSGWTLPRWEKDLRSVLWWGLRVHDAWMSFLNSRPSHVQSSNTNVPIPSLETVLHITSGTSVPRSLLPKTHTNHVSGHTSPTSPTMTSPIDSHSHSHSHSPTSPIDPTLRNAGTGVDTTGRSSQAQGQDPPHTNPNAGNTSITSIIDPSLITSAHSFIYLCRLSLLVAQLQSQVCTLSPDMSVDVVGGSAGDRLRSPNMTTGVRPGSPPSSVGRAGSAAGESHSGGVGREERSLRVRAIEQDVAVLLDEVRKAFFPSSGAGKGKGRKGNETSSSASLDSVNGSTGKELGGDRMETGVVSLMMCLLGFRCMLRRISIELFIGLGRPFTPDTETLDMYAEAVEFFCSLSSSHPSPNNASSTTSQSNGTATGPGTSRPGTTGGCDSLTQSDFDGFWFCYASHVLSSLTSSLIRLSLATTMMGPGPGGAGANSSVTGAGTGAGSEHQQQRAGQNHGRTVPVSARNNPLVLLCRLVTALRVAKEEANWDMAAPALERAESVARQLKETSSPSSSSSAEHLTAMDVDGGSSRRVSGSGGAQEDVGGMQSTHVNVIAALEGRFEPGPLQSPGEYYEPGHPLAPSSSHQEPPPQLYGPDNRGGYDAPRSGGGGEGTTNSAGYGPPPQGHLPQGYVSREQQQQDFVPGPGPQNGGYPAYGGQQVYPPHPYGNPDQQAPQQAYRSGDVSPVNEGGYGMPSHPSSHARMHSGPYGHPHAPGHGHSGHPGHPGGGGVPVGWENVGQWGVDMSAFGPYDWQRDASLRGGPQDGRA